MAECNQYTEIIVNGAGTSNIDGTYIPLGTTSGFTNFIMVGGTLNQIIQIDSQDNRWKIRRNPFPGAGFTAPYYQTPSYTNLEDVPACPSDAEVSWELSLNGSNPVPTVIGVESSQSISPQQRRKIYLRKQIKLGNKRGATLK